MGVCARAGSAWMWCVVVFGGVAPSLLSGQVALPRLGSQDRTLSPYFEVQGGVVGEDRLLLSETRVDVHVVGVIAAVTVLQVYENEGSRPLHARYVFPASTRAAVGGLRMKVGSRVVEAVIREKQEARKVFEKAKKTGRNAALLEQVRPNVFDMRVSNILPGDRIEVELRYTELLIPTEGVYEFVFPTVVGPRYSGGMTSADEAWPSTLEAPGAAAAPSRSAGASGAFDLRVRIDAGMPLHRVRTPGRTVQLETPTPTRATIGLLGPSRPDAGDFVLRYELADAQVASGLVLQEGADENFFLLMVEPPRRVRPEQVPPREYVFVVDVSGSMRGFPLETSKELLGDLVMGLNESDVFNVLLFAGASRLFSPESVPATAENVHAAWSFIDRQEGGGGTELGRALVRALALPRSGPLSRSLVVVTDGYVSAEESIFRTVRDRLNDGNVFTFGIGSSVNRHLVEGLARAGMSESFVVLDPAEAAATADRFRDYVSAPVLTDVTVDFGGLDVYDVTPVSIPDVFADRPVIVQGKWRGAPTSRVTLRGFGGEGAYERAFVLADGRAEGSAALRQLWARSRVRELAHAPGGAGAPEIREEITRIGLRYGLLTRYTSFVAVDRSVRNPSVASRDPGRPLQVASEPELWVLLLIPVALYFRAVRRRAGAGRAST